MGRDLGPRPRIAGARQWVSSDTHGAVIPSSRCARRRIPAGAGVHVGVRHSFAMLNERGAASVEESGK